jgi:hypothetical protein
VVDLFPDALELVDNDVPVADAARTLVREAHGSVERLLEIEHRAHALERALPTDQRARRVHAVVREAARLAMKTPCDDSPSSGLSDRLADVTGDPMPHAVDTDQLAADLDRLRAAVAR